MEAKTQTEIRVTAPEDIHVGDRVEVTGPDWLPATPLVVDEIDPEWYDGDGVVFKASLDRKNARDYTFRVIAGRVETSDSSGRWGVRVTATVVETADEIEADEDEADEWPPESATRDDGMVYTGHTFKRTATCDFYQSGHVIAPEFAEVLHAFEEAWADDDTDATVVAGGCNGCTDKGDADVWAYYVAQNDGYYDSMYVGYGAADDSPVGAKLVAYTLLGVADELGVPASWDGETSSKVCLGDATAYDE